jgi:hypothetical protein
VTITQELATIERVDIRSIWPNEADNFTSWLADNLDQLGDELGMELELIGREAAVGSFKLDILARETGRNAVVAIENQIESTDHAHLGQLLTYSAGSKADIVIWVTADFRDEHRAAMDWLNQRTEDSLEFYGVEIGAVRIGGSSPAPLFRLAAFPNSWSKRVTTSPQPISEKGEQYRRYWKPLLERLNKESGWGVKTHNTTSWVSAGSGISEVWRTMSFYVRNREVAVELSLQTPNKDWNKAFFDLLKESQGDIEARLGIELLWERLDNNKTSRLGVRRVGSIDADPAELDDMRAWMFDNVVRFKQVFPPYLREVRELLPQP